MGRPKGSTTTTKRTVKRVPRKKPEPDVAPPPPIRLYYCTACGEAYAVLKGKFRKSNSRFYQGNEGYINVCNKCIDHFEKEYTDNFYYGDNDKAIKRLCMAFDWYFNDSLLLSSKRANADTSRVSSVISKSQLTPYNGRTYDDVLKENTSEGKIESIADLERIDPAEKIIDKINEKTLAFWGTGFASNDYIFLNNKYDDWTSRHECKTKAQESIFQKICLMELQITKAVQSDGKVDGLVRSFNDLLGSANLRPVQNKDNALADQNAFGTLIQKWENERPIPDPDPEWQDVDGIGKYISIWFLGHLCKMLNINNSYGELYENEVKKYTVAKPQYDEDMDGSFDDVFGKPSNSTEDREKEAILVD